MALQKYLPPRVVKLFEGTWDTNETKTVDGLGDYCMFAIYVTGAATPIITFSSPDTAHPNALRGIGGYVNTTPNIWIYSVNFDRSGDTLTLVECRNIAIGASTSYHQTVEYIYGII